MNIDQARYLLNSIRGGGSKEATIEQINEALYLTGDLVDKFKLPLKKEEPETEIRRSEWVLVRRSDIQ